MEANEVLRKWLAYTEYDPERKAFMLGSLTSEFHWCNQTISKFMSYNPSGEIAVLYAKHRFQKIMADQRLNAFAVISQPGQLQPHFDMWKLFCSEEVQAIETSVLNDFNDLLSKVVPAKMLGQRDMEAERSALMGAVEAVVEALHKCNVDLFLRGGTIQRVNNFSTHIHVFNQLAECLLALEGSPDGMYLCYVRDNDSVNGYFGFYIKSNGTILSINERLNEAYPGAHKKHRNNRYAEAKQYSLFPYSFIFSYEEGGYDYKGYALSHVIDEEKLAFFQLKPEAYLPLVIAMVLLRNRYENCDTCDMPLLFVDSLLPVNLALPTPGTEALMVPGNSMIAEVNRGLHLNFTTEDVVNGTHNHLIQRPVTVYDDEFEPMLNYRDGEENIFIQKYGEGFTLDADSLMESNRHLKRLTSAELATTGLTPNAEFVGTAERMTQVAYMNGRRQLAEYIREKMFREYTAFGGRDAIEKWWQEALPKVKDKLIAMCVERYNNGKNNAHPVGEGQFSVLMDLDCTERPTREFNLPYPINTWGKLRSGYPDFKTPLCCITGQKASHYFSFTVDCYEQMVALLGAENVPEILTGYRRRGHRIFGNDSLTVTDPMTGVGTPFEEEEYRVNRRLWTEDVWRDYILRHPAEFPGDDIPYWDKVPQTAQKRWSVCNFNFIVAFSKRGLLKAAKAQ